MTFDPAGANLDPEAVQERVDSAIEDNEVVLFMKGSELMPQCGYSQKALELIQSHRDEYETVDVLDALADVKPLSAPRDVSVRDRCLATTDAERYSEATEAIPELSVEVVEDARDRSAKGRR